ncbi:MAG: divalent metal cation transporter [Wenzhouxiangellaceae bacterium]|nr:divalent metal cation transporter [Wenzhouxiangellaceae bacterium]
MNAPTLRLAIGPGLLMAAAAVGVSHLVQATRAGALYGLALLGIMLAGCLFKYPFLEFGPRYAAATGEHMILGYRRLGRWAWGIYGLLTVSTMFIVLASVTLVTAGLAGALFGLGIGVEWLAAAVLTGCAALLIIGHYRWLDRLMKVVMSVLALATLIAVISALTVAGGNVPAESGTAVVRQVTVWNSAGLAFTLALLGWMPIPLDSAAWHSLWTLERARNTGHRPSVREAGIDFAIGYGGAVVLAVAFLLLGALMLHGSGEPLADSAVGFASQLVDAYARSLGAWAGPLIAFAALATMFSTTLTVCDAFPRVLRALLEPVAGEQAADLPGHRRRYIAAMLTVMAGAWLVIAAFGGQFTRLIDFITTVSFLSAPVLAWMNLRLVTSAHVPSAARPPRWLRALAWAGLAFLVLFAATWLGWRMGLLEKWLGA